MVYSIGDFVFYPLHGAGIVRGISQRQTDEGVQSFYEIEFPSGSLKLMVPVHMTDEVSMRPIIKKSELPELLEYTKKSCFCPDDQNWNKRQKSSLDMIKSGDIKKTIDVYKYLYLRNKEKILSSGEKKMMTTARSSLLSEIQYATEMSFEEIDKLFLDNMI